MAENWECDGNGPHTAGVVHRMELPGNAGINLCKADWQRELLWRQKRNRDLAIANRFALPKWPGDGAARRRRAGHASITHRHAHRRT